MDLLNSCIKIWRATDARGTQRADEKSMGSTRQKKVGKHWFEGPTMFEGLKKLTAELETCVHYDLSVCWPLSIVVCGKVSPHIIMEWRNNDGVMLFIIYSPFDCEIFRRQEKLQKAMLHRWHPSIVPNGHIYSIQHFTIVFHSKCFTSRNHSPIHTSVT